MALTATSKLATEKQLNFAHSLVAERSTDAINNETLMDILGGKTVTMDEISKLINELLAAPKKAAHVPAAGNHAVPGYYVTDAGTIYVVVENKAKTRTYAKMLTIRVDYTGTTRASWDYAPGAAAALSKSSPLTVEEAGRLGHMHGICIICCKRLTDPVSVKQGIGPVCIKRLR